MTSIQASSKTSRQEVGHSTVIESGEEVITGLSPRSFRIRQVHCTSPHELQIFGTVLITSCSVYPRMMSAAQDSKWPLEVCLSHLGLQDYQAVLATHDFNSWLDVIDITEEDMSDMNFKRGHRRKLQRAIASFHGKHVHQPLICSSLSACNAYNAQIPPSSQEEKFRWDARRSVPSKRRYRRRPPKDPHAPERPRSGYVLFASFLRQNQQVADLSFVDIAKLVGEKWHCLFQKEQEVWTSLAAAQRSKYKLEVLRYRQSEHYQIHRDRLQTYNESKLYQDTVVPHSGLNRSSRSSQGRRLSKSSSTTIAAAQLSKHTVPYATGTPISVSSSSSLQDSHKFRFQFEQHNERNVIQRPVSTPFQRPLQHPETDSGWPKLLQKHQSVYSSDPIEIDEDVLALRNRHSTKDFRDCYIQDINPFHTASTTIVWPLLDSFLEWVNNSHTFIGAEYLAQQFQLAVDVNSSLPNHIMYTLCLCISIGCQLHVTGNDAMAIFWYENGLKYLDVDGWDMNLNVTRALALISMFHMGERPATAYCYLGAALKIGMANNNPGGIECGLHADGTSDSEWTAILGTLDAIHRCLRVSVTSLLGGGAGPSSVSSGPSNSSKSSGSDLD